MGHQSQIFLQSEGKAWLERNAHILPLERDPIIEALDQAKIHPGAVLEIGCANGWRLYELQDRADKIVYACGIDPCIDINHEITDTNLTLLKGTADNIPFQDKSFDLVIYGFCLYLCDPEDYFRIVAEGDRVLSAFGHICIFDFFSQKPYARRYEHAPGLFSHKMDFSQLWLGNPAYHAISRTFMGSGDGKTCVSIIQKTNVAFPVRD